MKRIICVIVIAAMIVLPLVSCGNRQILDTTYTFTKAIIKMPNDEVIEVSIKSWKDFEDGDQIQIKASDGTTYLVHSANVILISD